MGPVWVHQRLQDDSLSSFQLQKNNSVNNLNLGFNSPNLFCGRSRTNVREIFCIKFFLFHKALFYWLGFSLKRDTRRHGNEYSDQLIHKACFWHCLHVKLHTMEVASSPQGAGNTHCLESKRRQAQCTEA